MTNRLTPAADVANGGGAAGRPAPEVARAAARGEQAAALPLRSSRATAPAPTAEWLHEIDAPLGVAHMAASLQAERLRELTEHLGAFADRRVNSLLADLNESGQLLGDSLDRSLRLLRHRHRPSLAPDAPAGPAEALPLASVLEHALRSPLARYGELAIGFALDVEPELATPGYPSAWSQVFTNLVANSALHGFQGRRGGQIRVTARRSSATVLRVTYADDGIGLSPAAREQAFRGRFTSRAAEGSSGLGLCILRNVVQAQLNGAIALLDTTAGAAFAIDVPARRAA